ncbi:unnamed protein product [Urochloa humidicola]
MDLKPPTISKVHSLLFKTRFLVLRICAARAVERSAPLPMSRRPWCRRPRLRPEEASAAGERCFVIVIQEQQQQEADDKR